jgi:hypothetical protein
VPGHQLAQQHQVTEHVQVAVHGLGVDHQTFGQLRHVEQAALQMGQHGPQATQGLGRQA